MRLRFLDRVHPFFWFFVIAILAVALGLLFESMRFLIFGGLFVILAYAIYFVVWFWLKR